jgi:hypothetical protein
MGILPSLTRARLPYPRNGAGRVMGKENFATKKKDSFLGGSLLLCVGEILSDLTNIGRFFQNFSGFFKNPNIFL